MVKPAFAQAHWTRPEQSKPTAGRLAAPHVGHADLTLRGLHRGEALG